MGQQSLNVYRGCTPVVDAEYEFESDGSPAEVIVEALAEAAEIDPLDLPSLYEFVDPDALDQLFGEHDGAAHADALLSFQVETWNVFVRADANTGWESYERATSAIDRIDRQAFIEYYEQPVAADAVGDLRSLRTGRGVPVFADEAVHGVDEVRALTREPAAVSGVCAKLAKAGSLGEIVRMGELAADAGLPVTLVSAFETSLGVAANLHIASVLPTLSSAVELGANLIAEDPVDRSIERAADTPVPAGPGLGVELDDALFD